MMKIGSLSPASVMKPEVVACPACGGLECFCRPRFFAGQLLTDEDLNRLDRYVRGKNRLHNRYLQGYGTVAGLQVECGPCEGHVTVHTGYAISPCGDDIVVCDDDDVDVCALINQCRDGTSSGACDPPRAKGGIVLGDSTEEWLLRICYEERASRGVAALRATGRPASRCGCGGRSAGCGCGCDSASKRTGCECGPARGGCNCASGSAGRPKPWTATSPASCEPTMVCEGYRYEVCRVAEPVLATGIGQNITLTLGESHAAFWKQVDTAMPKAPADRSIAKMRDWMLRARSSIDRVFVDAASDCGTPERLRRVPLTEVADNEEATAYALRTERAVAEYATVAARSYADAICAKLLPPDLDPGEDCVTLAVLTVRRSDCSIVKVCNLAGRDIALSWQAVRYWMAVSGLEAVIRGVLASACCDDTPERLQDVTFEPASHLPHVQPQPAEPETFTERLYALGGAPGGETFDPAALLLDALGATKADGAPLVSNAQRAMPFEASVLGRFTPAVAETFRPVLGPAAAAAAGKGAKPAAPGRGRRAAAGGATPTLVELHQTVADLRQELRRQATEINRLKRTR